MSSYNIWLSMKYCQSRTSKSYTTLNYFLVYFVDNFRKFPCFNIYFGRMILHFYHTHLLLRLVSLLCLFNLIYWLIVLLASGQMIIVKSFRANLNICHCSFHCDYFLMGSFFCRGSIYSWSFPICVFISHSFFGYSL